MLYLLLSIFFSVLLLVNFRLHPRFGINTLQSIVFNYPICFLTGLILLPENQHFSFDFARDGTFPALAMGVGFIITFLLSGASTQRMGMTATSLANNMSLVIPVLFNLFVFKTSQNFDGLNYLGLVFAIVAVLLSTFKKEENQEKRKRQFSDFLLPIAVFTMYGITNTSFSYLNIRYVTSSGNTIPFTLTILIGAIFAGLLLLTIRVLQKKETVQLKNIMAAIPLGIPNFLSFYFLLKALDSFQNNGAYVLPVYNIGVIMSSALVALFFFREKLQVLNKIGLFLAVLAIALISYQALQTLFQA